MPSPSICLALTVVLFFPVLTRADEKPFNVRDYGAKGDGVSLDTEPFQRALAAAAATPDGIVVVPKGTFLTGSLSLPGHTTLVLEAEAILQGADSLDQYPIETARWEGREEPAHRALVSARDGENIVIRGEGEIRGGPTMPDKQHPHRPMLIELINCQHVSVTGVHLFNFNTWCLHPTYCSDVKISHVVFKTRGVNSDGVDPDSSHNVQIDHCSFEDEDDCIAIKSGVGQEAARIGKPSEDITVSDCHFIRGGGGVALGSECSGGIRRVRVERCVAEKGVTAALYLKTRPGRGAYLEDVTATDLVSRARRAIWVQFDYKYTPDPQGVPGQAGYTRTGGIRVENLQIDGGTLLDALGMEEKPIQGFYLAGVKGTCAKGMVLQNADGVTLHDINVTGYTGPVLSMTNVSGAVLDDALKPPGN